MFLSVWDADQAAEISYGFSLDLRLVKLVPVYYCFYIKNEFLNCTMWPVGTMEHLVLLVVSCCTKCEDTWSGKCLGWMYLLFVLWPEECLSGEGWDRSLKSSVDHFLVLYSNVPRLRLVSINVTDPGCLERKSPIMKRAALCWIFLIFLCPMSDPDGMYLGTNSKTVYWTSAYISS